MLGNTLGLVTSGNDFACHLINSIENLHKSVTVPFIITESPLDAIQTKSKIIKVNSNLKERDYEYYLGEFLKYPTKKLLFIEFQDKIPKCLNNYYECYTLLPAIKEKTGSWEEILGEVLLTKADHVGCYIKKDSLPIVYHKFKTSDFNWKNFNRRKDIFKSDLYLKLQRYVRESMVFITMLFIDILPDLKIMNNKVYINNLLTLNGINSDQWIRNKTYGSDYRVCEE